MWLKVFGTNSIVAYMLGELADLSCLVTSVSYGLEQYLGDYYAVWLRFGEVSLIALILTLLYRHKIFVKI